MKHLFLVLVLGFGVGAVDAQTVDPCRADIDRSGTVDFRDFLFLADSFGKNRCGLYWLGEDIRLTIWDTLIVRDTLVVRETLRDTLVLRETIRDTLYVVLAQPEQPQPPQPQPQPEPSQPEPSPPPQPPPQPPQPPPQPQPQPSPPQPQPEPQPEPQPPPTPPATPTLSLDIVGPNNPQYSLYDEDYLSATGSNGIDDGKTSSDYHDNLLIEVFIQGVTLEHLTRTEPQYGRGRGPFTDGILYVNDSFEILWAWPASGVKSARAKGRPFEERAVFGTISLDQITNGHIMTILVGDVRPGELRCIISFGDSIYWGGSVFRIESGPLTIKSK